LWGGDVVNDNGGGCNCGAENGYRVMVLVVAVWVGVEVVVIVVAALMTVIVVLGILAVGHCAPALLKA